jgi:hypothetical protein
MSQIGQRYAVPVEVDQFVDDGFLEVLTEIPDEMTVEFHIPSMVTEDHKRRLWAYRIVWIHAAHNAQFCHYYENLPGDLPNFYVEVHSCEGPSEIIDDLKTPDDLADWLEEFQSTSDPD